MYLLFVCCSGILTDVSIDCLVNARELFGSSNAFGGIGMFS